MDELKEATRFIIPVIARGTLSRRQFTDNKWFFTYKNQLSQSESNVIQISALSIKDLLKAINEKEFKELTIQMIKDDEHYEQYE